MRREKPEAKPISTTMNAFLFLWWKCECCEQQVRLETVWTFGLFHQNEYGGGNSRVVAQRVMVCKECCPTIELADSFSVAFNEGRNSFPDSSGTPVPKCKDPKPEGPQNEIIGDKMQVSRGPDVPTPVGPISSEPDFNAPIPEVKYILSEKRPRTGRKRDLQPPPQPLKRKGVCFYSGKKL